MADISSSQHALKQLSSSLVLVVSIITENPPFLIADLRQLHQTGKILRDPSLRNPRQSGLIQRRVKEYVPFANQQFHDALDDIEVEIVCRAPVLDTLGMQIPGRYQAFSVMS